MRDSEGEQVRMKDILESHYQNIKLGRLDQESLGRIDKDVERTDRSVFYPGDHSTPISALPRSDFFNPLGWSWLGEY